MLLEGTCKKNHLQIAEELEISGATVHIDVNEDFACFSLMCSTENIPDVLPLVHHVLHESVFPEEQLRIITANDKQDYLTNLQKVSFLARRQLFISLFTNNHPYTLFAEEKDFDNIRCNDLIEFYKAHYNIGQMIVVWTGIFSSENLDLFTGLFGSTSSIPEEPEKPEFRSAFSGQKRNNIELENAKQSAIYLGCVVPGVEHPDHFNLIFCNTVLGGYFGSRLMKNLREVKGYTYGIGSNIINYDHLSVFMIGTQVKAEHTEDSIHEINKELLRLQTNTIDQKELALVRNYLAGTLLQSIDGPFAQSGFMTNLIRRNMEPQEYLQNFLTSIRQITPEAIKLITIKYLPKNNLIYSVSGKIKE
jgi:predicted Zn-dependent peptidase